MTTFGDENVSGLDVAMNDAARMSGVQSVGNLDSEGEQNVGFEGLATDAMLQGHAIEKFHGDESLKVLLADVVDSADVGMIQR